MLPAIVAPVKTFSRFSVPEVRGELPRSGALVMDHSVCRGVIFIDNQQTIPHDKGEVIAEYVSLLLQTAAHKTSPVTGSSFSSSSRLLPPIGGVGMASPLENLASSVAAAAAAGITPENGMHMNDGGGGGGRRGQYSRGSSTSLESIPVEPTAAQPLQQRKRKCVLVDNTSRKCERAVTSFAKMGLKSLELHTVHFTEAERQVGSPEALVQLSRILSRLRAQGQIGEDLLVDGITTQAPQVPQVGETAAAAAVLSGGNAKPQLGALRSGRNRMGSSTERCGTLPPKRDGSLGPSPVFET